MPTVIALLWLIVPSVVIMMLLSGVKATVVLSGIGIRRLQALVYIVLRLCVCVILVGEWAMMHFL